MKGLGVHTLPQYCIASNINIEDKNGRQVFVHWQTLPIIKRWPPDSDWDVLYSTSLFSTCQICVSVVVIDPQLPTSIPSRYMYMNFLSKRLFLLILSAPFQLWFG